MNDASGEFYVSYDARGRARWIVKKIADPINGVLTPFRFAMTYDSADRVTWLTYPDDDRLVYEYNERRLVERIRGGASANLDDYPHIVNAVEYASSGQTLQTVYGNGIATDRGYDARQRLVATTSAPVSGPPILDYRYQFDAVSCLTRIDDLRPAEARPAGDPLRNTQQFSYDDVYRLTGVQYSFDPPGTDPGIDGQIAYRYDRIGNMLSATSDIAHVENGLSLTNLGAMGYGGSAGPSGRIGRSPSDPPGPHALTSVEDGARAYDYDGNGNMVAIEGKTCTYDFRDRLVLVEDDTMRARYIYDFNGARTIKKVWTKDPVSGALSDEPSTVVRYIDKMFEVRDFDQPIKYVYNGDTRVARVTGSLNPDGYWVQRFRVLEGWNLFVMVVRTGDAVAQLGLEKDPNIEAMFGYNAATGKFSRLNASSSLKAGSVFWIKATNPDMLEVRGKHTDPDTDRVTLDPGGDWFFAQSLEAAHWGTDLPPQISRTWAYDAFEQAWQPHLTENWSFLSEPLDFAAPGQPIYVSLFESADVEIAKPEQRICYYHQDHLGSSNVIADANGNIQREEVYYPF
ncbi:MAG: repeat-associated core domain protein, partial [Candidatus Hydrogenedentes bacterium]|nr:repeat-associated core domain protein [Candidatus Hydrogenedentota bacterium]